MLVNLKLLARVSSGDRLEGVKFKCLASYELVKKIGKAVRFEVGSYLFDFVD